VFPATVPVLKSSHDPSAPLGMTCEEPSWIRRRVRHAAKAIPQRLKPQREATRHVGAKAPTPRRVGPFTSLRVNRRESPATTGRRASPGARGRGCGLSRLDIVVHAEKVSRAEMRAYGLWTFLSPYLLLGSITREEDKKRLQV
jgi:hypothetical protein